MSRFVRPETALLTLANGDTLVVKVRLNTGETRALRAAILAGSEASAADRAAFPVVLAYLLDWSITDDGRPVVIREQPGDVVRAILDSLDYDSFIDIANAIGDHVHRQAQLRAEEKKNPDYRDRIVGDLAVAVRCGWRYEWVAELDPDVHDILIAELTKD